MSRPPRSCAGCARRWPASRGFSLVEILVALALGLVLAGAMLHLLSTNLAGSRLALAQAHRDTNWRAISSTLATRLAASRGVGCGSLDRFAGEDTLAVTACGLLQDPGDDGSCSGEHVLRVDAPLAYDGSLSSSGGWLSGLPGGPGSGAEGAVTDHWLRGDILVAWAAGGRGHYVSAPGTIGIDRAGDVTLTGAADEISDLAAALITDCQGADVFAVTANTGGTEGMPRVLSHAAQIEGDPVNSTATLSRAYNYLGVPPGPPIRARLFPFDYEVYFVCCTALASGDIVGGESLAQCASASQTHEPALCRWSLGAGLGVYAPAVANLQVRLDGTAADGRRFREVAGGPASPAWVQSQSAWERADTLHVSMLVASDGQATAETASPADRFALGADLPADRRLYHQAEFSSAIRALTPWSLNPE